MNLFEKLKGELVLVQLSGGKDSITALHILLEHGISCKAIHFIHKWCYHTPTQEAERICREFGVEIKIHDITDAISDVFLSGFSGRPCRICKGIMDRITVEYAEKINSAYICTGDSKSDRTLFRRLKNVNSIDDMYINCYFNSTFELPKNIRILRPLAEMDSDDVMKYLSDHSIKVRRVGDTGDKYSEYSREGCPLQFKDYGAEYTAELMEKLKHYNEKCSAYATAHDFRASIHLPSRFIVTIPDGRSEEVRKAIGIDKPDTPKHSKVFAYLMFIALCETLRENESILSNMMQRMCERLEIDIIETQPNYFNFRNGSLTYTVTNVSELTVCIIQTDRIPCMLLGNIIKELFHTDQFSVSESISKE